MADSIKFSVCPLCRSSVPEVNMDIHSARCGNRKRQRVTASAPPALDIITSKEGSQDDEDFLLAIALSLGQDRSAGDGIRSAPSKSCTISSSSTSSSPTSYTRSQVPTSVDWGRTDWLWAHAPLDTAVGRFSDSTQSLWAQAFVLDAFKESQKYNKVAAGAMGSKQLYDKCIEAIAKYPAATTSGKWLLRIGEDCIDDLWDALSRHLQRNELGTTIKTREMDAPFAGGMASKRMYLICIYTKDFRDTEDVARVYRQLNSILKTFYASRRTGSSSTCSEAKAQKITDSYKADIVTLAFAAYGTTEIKFGTFYQGDRETSVVHLPKHFESNGGAGSKVSVP